MIVMTTPGDLHALLEGEIQRARSRIDSLVRAFDELVGYSAGDPPDDEHDPEGATIGWERAQVIALRQQAEGHLTKLEAARQRLVAGEFGLCESCGVPIAEARLLARPETTRCIDCADK